MKADEPLKPCLIQALEKMNAFVTAVTGREPTQEELAAALGRFFVLEEIKSFIQIERDKDKDKDR